MTIYALCRKSSTELTKLIITEKNETTTENELRIIEDIDVMSYDIGTALRNNFRTEATTTSKDDSNGSNIIPTHLLIHNAGA